MKDNKGYAYKITFFGETIELKNKLKEKKLASAFQGVNTYDHSYNVSTVKTGLESSLVSGAVKYPLISHTERFLIVEHIQEEIETYTTTNQVEEEDRIITE
ncbi:MAG: hypothetical protein CM15mV109_310 [uncultured marine virus]|nr:MAG: hypothetical protein CM15mV109_310 [uncultured marine virus]